MMDKKILVLGATAIVSAGTGLVVGYELAKRRLRGEFEERLDEDIQNYKNSYDSLQKMKADKKAAQEALNQMDEVPVETLQRVLDGLKNLDEPKLTAAEAMVKYSGGAQTADRVTSVLERFPKPVGLLDLMEPDDVQEETNLFDSRLSPDVSQEYLDSLRIPGQPYIISHLEFVDGQSHQQSSLTWYDDDGVLSDDQDVPVDDVDNVVGLANMERFGIGSGDMSIVYIRNEKLRTEFEVVFNHGSYAQIVYGQDPDPKRQKLRRQQRGADE